MTALAVFLSPDTGDRVALGLSSTTFGRSEENDTVLNGSGISRFHAVVDRIEGGHVIRDLQSRNGTFVNGEQVEAEGCRLADGDLVVFAGSAAYRYLDPQATPMVPRLGHTEGVWIDETTDNVWVDAQLLDPPLSARQQALLVMLVQAGGRPVSRAEVVAGIWRDAQAEGVSDDAVSALVKRLRARLRDAGKGEEQVEVLRGRGFRLAR